MLQTAHICLHIITDYIYHRNHALERKRGLSVHQNISLDSDIINFYKRGMFIMIIHYMQLYDFLIIKKHLFCCCFGDFYCVNLNRW